MIIQVRGTSGSGKSTAVRAILGSGPFAPEAVPAPADFPKKRRHPVGYFVKWPPVNIFILGHYESACGGCDTLPSYEVTFGLIKKYHDWGYHVLFEGLLVAHDKKQCKELWDHIGRKDFVILELTESLETCLASVKSRRLIRGADPETFNPTNTTRRYAEVVTSCRQLEEHGIPVVRVSRAECVVRIVELLGVPDMEVAAA